MDDPLPTFPWQLSAPESLVLLWGPDTGDAWALKVGLLELVVRRALILKTVDQRRFLRRPRQVNIVTLGEPLDASAPRPLRVIIEVFPIAASATDPARGVPIERLALAVLTRAFRAMPTRGWPRRRTRWVRSGDGYVKTEVLPALERRGLYARAAGSFGGRAWNLTSEGAVHLERLQRLMAAGRDSFAEWVEHRPEVARDYVDRAGAALLLLGGLAPLFRRLRERSGADDDGWRLPHPFTVAALAGAFGPGPQDDLDAAFFALSTEVDLAWQGIHERADGGGE